MAKLAKLFVIAVDSADAELLSQWAKAGHLPTWQALQENGLALRIRNPVGLFSGVVWPSFYTGVSPARHGRYCLAQFQSGGYEDKPITSSDVKSEPFWEALARTGRRIAVIDVPKARLTSSPNIVQIADWGTHDPDPVGLRCWPKSIREDVVARFGEDPVGVCDDYGDAGDLGALRDRLLERVGKKQEMIAHFLEQGPWDLFIGGFSETHCAGHQFWHVHDPGHPKHDPRVAKALGDPLLDVYRAIDSAIGELIAMLGKETPVLVHATHGIGPHYDGTYLLDDVLRRLEGGKPPPASFLRRGSMWLRRTFPWRRLLPAALRDRGRAAAVRLEHNARTTDRRRRAFFQITTNNNCAGVRINLRGRDPDGKVAPGAEYEAQCDALEADLKDLVNADTGRPAVRAIYRTDELYPGEHRDDFPDILVEWNPEAEIAGLASPKIGEVRGVRHSPRTGDHRPDGLLIARAPGLAAGRASEDAAVADLAPTIAAALDVELDGVDGHPIPSLTKLRAVPAGHP